MKIRLRAEFEWSEDTARRCMQVYLWKEALENKNFVFSRIGISALYLLAALSTLIEARAEILDLAEDGKEVVCTLAKTVINRHRKLSEIRTLLI